MDRNDETRFLDIMRYLQTNFPDRVVTPDLARSYFADLSNYGMTLDQIESAAIEHVQTSTRFPYVSELIAIHLTTPRGN